VLIPSAISEAYALPVDISAPLDHTYNLAIGNQSYSIKYGITGSGVVENMTSDYSSKSISVKIRVNPGSPTGMFTIEFPRNVIAANTTAEALGCSHFSTNGTVFWARNHDIPYKIVVTSVADGKVSMYNASAEFCSQDTRTLTINYPAGTNLISFQGTAMVPEFHHQFFLLLTIPIAAVILTVQRFKSLRL
jgi:hypothetical protein